MSISVTELRANIYRLIDEVIETGQPLEIERNGHTVLLTPSLPESRLSRLVARPWVIEGDPEDLVHLDWYDEWKP